MNKKRIAVNLVSAILANGIGLAVSGFASLFVPKFLDDVDYGYWQLFVFYITYIGLFHFGLQDGIYLRYGGKHYEELDKPLFHTQFLIMLGAEVLIALVIVFLTHFTVRDINRQFVLRMFGCMCIVYLPSLILQYILQMTNRIVDYSKCLIVEKGAYGVFMIVILLFGYRSFEALILADVCGRFVAFIYGAYLCREIVFSKQVVFRDTTIELRENIKAGVPLLLANLAGMFVIGIVRFAIEMKWDIVSFGHVSMAITLCNFILIFLVAIGQVLFPMLKRAEESELPDIYKKMSCGIVLLIAAALLCYQPVKWVMDLWIPNYASSIGYLALLFPLCIFEGKTNMLLNTYYKVMRRERALLIINIGAMLGSAVLAGISVFWMGSITWAAISIVVACAFRCITCEVYLQRKMQIYDAPIVVLECFLTVGFIVINTLLNGVIAMFCYFVLVCMSVLLCRKTIIGIFKK